MPALNWEFAPNHQGQGNPVQLEAIKYSLLCILIAIHLETRINIL